MNELTDNYQSFSDLGEKTIIQADIYSQSIKENTERVEKFENNFYIKERSLGEINMEEWDILDEKGKVTGKTMKKGEKIVWQEGIYHQGADVWIINKEKKILIQKRARQKKLEPNVWAMTGGSVIKGETPLETLKRETLEELGIELNIEKAVKIHHYRTGNVWLDEYIVEQEIDLKDIIMQKEEVSEVKFATFEEIEKLYKENMFIKNRWEFVREVIREYI